MKKRYFQSSITLILLAGLLISCKKHVVPSVTTSEIKDISGTSALCGGTLTDEGSHTVTALGVCWSTNNTPTIADYFTSEAIGTEDFISQLSDLDITTTYYVRAYATNKAGTGYGEVKSPALYFLRISVDRIPFTYPVIVQ